MPTILFDDAGYLYGPTLGNLLTATTVRVETDNVTWLQQDGYLWSQAASSPREFGLYRFSDGDLEFFVGGTVHQIPAVPNLNDEQVIFEINMTTGAYTINWGATTYTGTATVGTGRVDGALFRVGARANSNTPGDTSGTYLMRANEICGDVRVYIDGVLTRDYQIPNNAAATTIPDAVGGNDLTLTSFVTGGVQEDPLSALTIDPLDNNRVYQRTGASRNVTVTGTYSTGDGIDQVQVRILRSGDNAEIVTWADATLNAGNYSISISVPASSDFYYTEARSLVSTVVQATENDITNTWAVGDVFACFGSSSVERWFSQGANSNLSYARYYISNWGSTSTTSQGAASFAAGVNAATGYAVGLISRGFSGSTLAGWASQNSNYTSLVSALSANDDEIAAYVSLVGYNDAANNTIASTAAHVSNYTTLISNLTAIANVPFYIIGSQRGVGRSDAQWRFLLSAELAVTGATYCASTIDLEISGDNVHLTPAAYGQQGSRAGAYVGEHFSGGSPVAQPSINNAVKTTNTTTTVTISSVNDITPTSAITGFVISDDSFSTSLSITSVARLNSSSLVITHASTESDVAIRYQYEANPDISAAVFDSTNSLPLLYETDLSATTASESTDDNQLVRSCVKSSISTLVRAI